MIEVVNILDAEELNEKIEQSDIVICRSGYTSIMDLIKLRKKAILIPTPGQTEQEYLAIFHYQKGTFLSYRQEHFNLSKALESANIFEWKFPDVNMEKYKLAIETLISTQIKNSH
jgi:UDP-N-acetylglucosamine:LPS N-acetylglucosamine transferase